MVPWMDYRDGWNSQASAARPIKYLRPWVQIIQGWCGTKISISGG